MPSVPAHSAKTLDKFVTATNSYAENVIRRADKNHNGNLTRVEARAGLRDMRDTFDLYAKSGKTVKTEEFITFYKDYVRVSAKSGALPQDLQDNVKNWLDAQRPPAPTVVQVDVQTDHPEIVKSNTDGVVVLDHNEGPVGANVFLRFDGNEVRIHKYRGGFGTWDLADEMPEGYAASASEGQPPNHNITTVKIVKDSPEMPSTSEALEIVRAGFPDFIRNERSHEGDWQDYLSSDWETMVADGIMEGINNFGVFETEDDGSISRYPNKYVFCGRGPYDLHTEVVFDKNTRETSYYVEID